MPETIVAPVNGQTLASQYDIHDPVFEYTVADPKPVTAAVAPVVQPVAQPVSAVTPSTGTTTPPAPLTQPAQKHPTWLLQDATELGLHPLILERLETPELTQYVISEMKKARQNTASNQVAAAVSTPQSQQVQPSTNPVPNNQQGQTTQPQFDWGIHDDEDDHGRPIKKQITDKDIHPALAHHIKEQAKRIDQLERVVLNMHQKEVQTVEQQRHTLFDNAFNKLGGVFGNGTAGSLKGKPEFDRRSTVYAAVKGMYASLPEQAKEAISIEQAVFTMAKSLFNVDTPVAAAAISGQPTPDQFRSGGVQPPTQRRGNDQQFGIERAKEEAANWFRENQASGAIPANGGTSMEEFLPM